MKKDEEKRWQIRLHESAHAVANFKYGIRIDKIWVAPDFNKVKRGGNLGACHAARTDDPFIEAVVSLIGESCDRILSGVKPDTEVCETPWRHDENGNLRITQGLSSDLDRIDAHLAIDKLKALQRREGDRFVDEISNDLLLSAWGEACKIVREEEQTIRALAGFLSRQNDELSGLARYAFSS